ncbi:MAG: hypothetical protein IIB44_09420 [Candidatus Marinimicrobia bacterium]|nr:hypothetical protein [Candidatus Neomarinimicrobiota bacterium]
MHPKFVICVNNQGYEVSLERWKVYRVLPDNKAENHSQIRIVDESGEDYLFPEEYFAPIKIPKPIQEAMTTTA